MAGLQTVLKVLKQCFIRLLKNEGLKNGPPRSETAATSNALLSIWQDAKNTFAFKPSFSFLPYLSSDDCEKECSE